MVRPPDPPETTVPRPNRPPTTPAPAPLAPIARSLIPLAVLALTLAWALSGPAGAADPDPNPVIAQQGDLSLTADAVRAMLATLDPEQQQKLRDDPQAMANLVRDRLLQAALLREARDQHWDQRPDVIARAEQARDAAIADSYLAALAQPPAGYPSEAEIQSAYEANKAKLLIPRQYRLAQIFVAVPAGAPPALDTEAKARATALRQLWVRAKGDPAAVVKKDAAGPGPAATGMDLGWVREDRVAPAIRSVVAGMTDGAIADPIRLGDGWHVVRMSETRAAAPATLAEVHDSLARAMRQARQQQNARAHLDAMLRKTPIRLNEIELSHLTVP
jgi:parvulin-like peptidyl-prolyl isomerase